MVEKDLFIAFICRERISLTSLLFIHTHTHTYGTCARILFTDLHLRETSAHQELVVQRFIIPPPLHSHQKSRGNDLEAKRRCERVCVCVCDRHKDTDLISAGSAVVTNDSSTAGTAPRAAGGGMIPLYSSYSFIFTLLLHFHA